MCTIVVVFLYLVYLLVFLSVGIIWGATPKFFGGPLPFLPLPSSPPFPSVHLEVGTLNTARESGERCKLPQLALELSPSGKRICCILALKCDILWNQVY